MVLICTSRKAGCQSQRPSLLRLLPLFLNRTHVCEAKGPCAAEAWGGSAGRRRRHRAAASRPASELGPHGTAAAAPGGSLPPLGGGRAGPLTGAPQCGISPLGSSAERDLAGSAPPPCRSSPTGLEKPSSGCRGGDMTTDRLFFPIEAVLMQGRDRLNLSDTSNPDEPSCSPFLRSTCRALYLPCKGTWEGGVVTEETCLLCQAGTCHRCPYP